MKIKTQHIILIQGILLVLFLFVTAWFNRFSADDYLFMGRLRDFSFAEIYQKLYLTWNGRWTYNFAILFFIQFSQYKYFLFVFNGLSFLLLFYSIYLGLKALNKKYEANFNSKTILLYTLIFNGVFFFFTHFTGQSWFWISASLAYLWSCIFFLFGWSSWLKSTHHFFDYLLIIIGCLYIGGSNEVLALLTILLLLASFFLKGNTVLKVVTLMVLFASFSVNYFSVGTTFRDNLTPNLSFVDLVLYVGYGTIKYLILDGYKTILPAIVFAIPFFILGKNTTKNFSTKFIFKKELIKTSLFIASVVVLNQLIVIYALGGLAPDRSTTTSSLFGSLAIARFLFLYGNHSKGLNINFKPILLLTVVLMLLFNGVFYSIHKKYSQSVDERITFILSNNKNEPIILKKLNDAGYLNSAEISTDSTNFLNQHLKYGLGIEQQIILKGN
jgi:hypothetical protein